MLTFTLTLISLASLSLLGFLVMVYRRCLDYESIGELQSLIRPVDLRRLNLADLWNAWFNLSLLSRVCTLTICPNAMPYARALRAEAGEYRWVLLRTFISRRVVYIEQSLNQYETLIGLLEDVGYAEATP
jgi:hypothetical protein